MVATDPAAYLKATAPFQALPRDLFDAAAAAIEVGAHPAGTRLAWAGGAPLAHLYLIRKGVVRLERDGQVVQLVEEGETFGYTSLLSGEATLDVIADEDLVVYRLPGDTFRALLRDASFAAHFAVGLAERLKASLQQAPAVSFRPDLSLPVERLVRRPAVWVDGGATVGDAARVMRADGISSVLVRADPPGIVTDRDFRNRVLADDLGPETPLARVLSRPLCTVAASTPTYEAWTILLDRALHHLPVERDGELVGVLTSGDLLRQSAQGPVAVLRSLEHLDRREGLAGYGARVAEMAAALVAGRLDVAVIAGFVARLNDAVLRRIARWAQDDLGPPPAPFAWIAFGSEGRMEQLLLTDQDNALVYADAGADGRAWYQAFAERVNADLEAAGFPACEGGYMARNWSGPLSEWTRRFAGWIDSPQAQALLEASIFFDYRRVEGELDLGALDAVVAGARQQPIFLRFLARSAMAFRPPASLVLRLRGGSSEVDLKLHGIAPIVFLARCYGLEAGTVARNTLERIEAAARADLLDRELAETIAETHRFLVSLRLRLQLRALAEGGRPSNRVALGALGPVERSRVKEAFRAVRAFQDRAAFHYRTDF
jgi:CBS domain-containing protein